MKIADELEDLLDLEKSILLAGKLFDLPRLEKRKTLLLRALREAPPNEPEQINRLKRTAEANASLLLASGRGLKAAIRQIVEAKSQSGQSVYDTNGRRQAMVTTADRLEHKA